MKTLRQVLILILFLHAVLPVIAQPEAELIKSIKAKLDKVSDYQADGIMKIDVSFIKAPDAGIKIYYKKPDKFAIKKESGISILPKGGVHINLPSLLSDAAYTVVPAGQTTIRNVKVKTVKLLPVDENSDVVVTTLYIDDKALLIEKAIVTTKENGTYEMEMIYGKSASLGLPDQIIFTFSLKDYKLPKGVTFEFESGENKPANTPPKNTKGKIEITYKRYIVNKGFPDSVFQ